jgi:hypothetical protein
MKNDKLQAALEYAALGFPVFPCRPMTKVPATPNGFKDATTAEEQIIYWWTQDPNYNVAIATAGYLVIDMEALLPDWPPEHIDGPRYLTPHSGGHSWTTQPPGAGWRNTTKKLHPKVDTRADGGYCLVPPSELPAGKYRWPEGSPGMYPPPLTPQWLADELTRLNGTQPPQSFLEENRPIPEGARNNTLTQIGGWLRRHGMSQAAICAALQCENPRRCTPPLQPSEVLAISKSVSRYEPDLTATMAMEGVEIELDEEPETSYPDPGELPERLVFELPGLAEKVIEYTLKTSPCPQPVYALAGAMSLMSVITGRKIEDHSRTRTNLLSVILGKTGSGKDRPRQVNRQLLTEAGCDYLGPEEAVSGNGIYTSIRTRPTVLLQWDEMGLLFKQIQTGRSDGPLANARAILMKLYHSSAETVQGGGYADPKRNFELIQPHLVLLGSTVVENFAAGLSREQLTDGFMSRFSIFPSSATPDAGDPAITALPPGLIDEICLWRDFYEGRGNLATEHPKPRVLTYHPDAWQLLKDFRLMLNRHPDRAMWIRAYIQAKKSGMLFQASIDGPSVQEITRRAVEWAIELVTYQVRKTLYLASQFIADSQFEADQLEFGRWMQEKKKVSMGQICNSRFRKWKVQYRNEVIDALVGQRKISIKVRKGITKPTTLITWMSR